LKYLVCDAGHCTEKITGSLCYVELQMPQLKKLVGVFWRKCTMNTTVWSQLRVLKFLSPAIVLLGMGSWMALPPQSVLAQTQTDNVQPLQDFQRKDGFDPFSTTGGSGVTPGLFDMVHRAMQSSSGFGEDNSPQPEDLDAATANFRKQQSQLLQQQQPPQPVTAPTPPQP
jgi:hypothetical protein